MEADVCRSGLFGCAGGRRGGASIEGGPSNSVVRASSRSSTFAGGFAGRTAASNGSGADKVARAGGGALARGSAAVHATRGPAGRGGVADRSAERGAVGETGRSSGVLRRNEKTGSGTSPRVLSPAWLAASGGREAATRRCGTSTRAEESTTGALASGSPGEASGIEAKGDSFSNGTRWVSRPHDLTAAIPFQNPASGRPRCPAIMRTARMGRVRFKDSSSPLASEGAATPGRESVPRPAEASSRIPGRARTQPWPGAPRAWRAFVPGWP